MSFKWDDDITIDEQANYNEIQITMDILNENITN